MRLSSLMTTIGRALHAEVTLAATDQASADKTIGSAAVTLHLTLPAPRASEPTLPGTPLPATCLLNDEQRRRQDETWLRSAGWTPCGSATERHLWHRSYPGVLLRFTKPTPDVHGQPRRNVTLRPSHPARR